MAWGTGSNGSSTGRDDRGREVPTVGTAALLRAGPPDEQQPRRELVQWLKRVGASQRRFTWRTLSREVVLMSVGVGSLLPLVLAVQIFRLPVAAAVLAWIVLLFVVRQRQQMARVRPQLAASFVAEGICGSCAYPLAGLSAVDDGCVVCPECGAAWRASRIVGPLWRGDRGAALAPWIRPRTFVGDDPALHGGTDANGRLVPVLDSHLQGLGDGVRRDLGASRIRAIVARTRAEGVRSRVWLATAMMLGAGLWGGWTMASGLWAAAEADDAELFVRGVVGLVLLGAGAVLALTVLGSEMFTSNDRKTATIAAGGLCPSCAAPLGSASRDELGHAVCPECGSAWAIT